MCAVFNGRYAVKSLLAPQTNWRDMIIPIRGDFELQFKSPSGDLGANLPLGVG